MNIVSRLIKCRNVACVSFFLHKVDCSDGDIRLVGGESEREGRVEVCNNRGWGTVCGREWTDRHTAVVCRYFGFSDLPIGKVYILTRDHY